MTNHRSTRRLGTHRVPVALAAAALAAGALVTGTQMSSASEPPSTSVSLNRLEREAHLHLLEARREQVQQENRRAARTAQIGQDSRPAPDAEACRALLAKTWRDLGRFSDGYETYLMRRPPCAGL